MAAAALDHSLAVGMIGIVRRFFAAPFQLLAYAALAVSLACVLLHIAISGEH